MPKAKPKDPLAPPSRAVCGTIIKRYLKEDHPIVWPKDGACFYRLWKLYPSAPFWLAYELPFGNGSLNQMLWFEGVEGVEELKRAWLLYHYNPPEAPSEEAVLVLDNSPESNYDRGIHTAAPRRPRTIAELLANPIKPNQSFPSFVTGNP